MKSKAEAVREIHRITNQAVIASAAENAMREGTEQAYDRAIHEAKQNGNQLQVVNIANEQLGYPPNHTR